MAKGKKKVRVNMIQRYIAAERLSDAAIEFVRWNHNLYHVWKGRHSIGLTPKEQAELEQLWKESTKLQHRLSALREKLHKTAKINWKRP